MRGRRWARLVTGAAVATAVVALLPQAALASCASPPPKAEQIAQAGTVFVGTVEALSNDGYWATVRVEEVWKGPDLVPVVQVRGSEAEGPDQARTSIDRTYLDDTRYLFVLAGQGPPLRDDACSGTEVWNEDFAQYRPGDWRKPVIPEDEPDATTQTEPEDEPTSVGDDPDKNEGPVGEDAGEHVAHAGDEVLTTMRATGNGGGYDGRLWLAATVGLLGLVALGWWVRKES